jgi:hypothetical protein
MKFVTSAAVPFKLLTGWSASRQLAASFPLQDRGLNDSRESAAPDLFFLQSVRRA